MESSRPMLRPVLASCCLRAALLRTCAGTVVTGSVVVGAAVVVVTASGHAVASISLTSNRAAWCRSRCATSDAA